ncbi:MAG: ribonuclease P protein component [Candidatus Colwellbacteria bacterium]|nr:ribonuclease P protein component [Candidatus Colwellbacteria bacterium]
MNSPALAFKYIFTAAPAPQISFIAPKNVARLAVNRNALRRLGYKALEKNKSSLPPGLVGTFIFKNYQNNVAALENEIKSILSKIN